MASVLYNCKRCKVGRRVEYPERDQISLGYGRWQTRWFRLDRGRVYPGRGFGASGQPDGDAVCAQCGRFMDWDYLQATHNPSVRCDARCTNARGFRCDCSCGGKHHGAGWGQGYTEAAA